MIKVEYDPLHVGASLFTAEASLLRIGFYTEKLDNTRMLLFQNDVFVFSKTNVKMKIPASNPQHLLINLFCGQSHGIKVKVTQVHSLSCRKQHAEIITTPVLNSGLL